MNDDELERAARTMALPGVGVLGQEKISAARIVVIGAGGLGSPVLHYLASSGVGVIGIVDFDTVDRSNLQRQVIHRSSSIGMSKTASSAAAIAELNPNVRVKQHPIQLNRDNAIEVLREYDIVVDASDNFATRYLVSDCAALLHLPYVWGSVFQFFGQISVFWEGHPGAPLDFRDLHPVPPDPRLVLSCAEAGVLASLCGTMGSMMASEALKIAAGVGEPLIGRVQNLDALTGRWSEFELRRSPERVPVTALIDYDEFCGAADGTAGVAEISASALRTRLAAGGAHLVDVREAWEHDLGHIDGDELVPLAELIADPRRVGAGPVVVYCASGPRSQRAALALDSVGIAAVSLTGGFAAWRLASVGS